MSPEPSRGMTLQQLHNRGVGVRIAGLATQTVRGVQHDSREVTGGDLFVAVPGETHDGLSFVGDAVARGAVAVMAEQQVELEVPQLIVTDVRAGLGRAAELVYGEPTSALHTVGITGTNGKTTTAYLLQCALEGVAAKPALVGTTGWTAPGSEHPSLHTTPEGDDISRFARLALDAGATHLVLEVSSHGLAMHRVDALDFEVAAFTNLSRDHLDFHKSMDRYGEAKARLFTELRPKRAVIHVDDPFGAALAGRTPLPVLRCSKSSDGQAEILATDWSVNRAGIQATVETPAGAVEIRSPMLGEHNLENLLVALGCAYALGLDLNLVSKAWQRAAGSPGRLERIAHPQDVAVLVDYAHTPDALRRVLRTMRAVTPNRLIAVFGAGGDRDKGKRPEMGRVGVEGADLCVLTSDNPRTEDPRRILDEVATGAEQAGGIRIEAADLRDASRGFCRVVERREAIGAAILAAGPGDTVLLAGKGHENYQIIGAKRQHFDDREEARAVIASLAGGM
ncbi:MAG: UDP-N-acetylmuramoyl-L-alanyl-D-glutamate--2,6-diaminopimelate ligase [Polyangiales bacterium]